MEGAVAAPLWLVLLHFRIGGALQSSSFSLPDNYSKWEPPIGPDGEPVNVQLSMHIMDVVLDEHTQTVKFDSYFRTFWVENRIIFENLTRPVIQMDTDVTSKLWLPNIFALFVQKVEKPEFIVPAAGVHLYDDKTIFRSSLYLTTVKCNLLYFNYPMDRQVCTVKIQSYAYTAETLTITWHPKGITHEDIVMSSFYLEDIHTLPPTRTGVFVNSHAELSFEMRFKRKLRFSILAVYVPSLLVVMVSWLSLWVPPEMVPGRMVLVITTLLTLTALFSANVQGMPEVSYVKAIDVWTLACIVFVFGTILEYIIVLRLQTYQKSITAVTPSDQPKGKLLKGNWTLSGPEKAVRLERFSRVASVVAFAIFNIAYWAYYLG